MKTKRFRLKAIGDGTVSAVIATLNVKDHHGEVTLPGAFGAQEVPIVPTHNWRSVPLGKAKIREVGTEAIADMQFNLESDAGREWFSALKFDYENGKSLQQYSYGFDVLEGGEETHAGEPTYMLKKLTVFEVSPVLVGAGINTRTLAVKSGASMEQQFEDVEAALVSASGFCDRVKALATLRGEEGKEGRILSKANRDRLSRLKDLIGGVTSGIETLLGDSDRSDEGLPVDEIGQLMAETEAVKAKGDARLRA